MERKKKQRNSHNEAEKSRLKKSKLMNKRSKYSRIVHHDRPIINPQYNPISIQTSRRKKKEVRNPKERLSRTNSKSKSSPARDNQRGKLGPK